MSIVGTRPPTLDEWNKYELHHRARLAIKPGIHDANYQRLQCIKSGFRKVNKVLDIARTLTQCYT